jgi:hypothetical protein
MLLPFSMVSLNTVLSVQEYNVGNSSLTEGGDRSVVVREFVGKEMELVFNTTPVVTSRSRGMTCGSSLTTQILKLPREMMSHAHTAFIHDEQGARHVSRHIQRRTSWRQRTQGEQGLARQQEFTRSQLEQS